MMVLNVCSLCWCNNTYSERDNFFADSRTDLLRHIRWREDVRASLAGNGHDGNLDWLSRADGPINFSFLSFTG